MKISDKQFVKYLIEWWVSSNEIIHYFQVCEKLLKKYGKVVFGPKYLTEIQKASDVVAEILIILKKTGKTAATNIKNIIKSLKEVSKDYKQEFMIKSDSKDHNEKIKSHLITMFEDSKINQNQVVEQDEVRISGEWRYYKRWFEQDVKGLLNI